MKKNLKLRALHADIGAFAKEDILYALQGMALVGVFGYFFYKSLIITLMALPLSLFFVRYKRQKQTVKKRNELRIQFKEALVSINGSYRAGYSLENAFIEAEKDMSTFYGKKGHIVKELKAIRLGLGNNVPLTRLIEDMGVRTGVSDIREFASILVIGKQTGGNIADMIETFINVAQDKVSAMQEIETMIGAKKMEQKIMSMVPFFIIFYIDATSKGFFDVLYNNLAGRMIMTVCLFLYIVSVFMAQKITDIRI
ncbi:MAG: type II secretion system F family protein [Lachnospiraceae bacterium]|nr:type II secretion system F family protein [Lachnospiraceae bacterium]